MTITKYESHFYTSSRYSIASIFTESGSIKKFVNGLSTYYQMKMTQIVIFSGSSQNIVDHAKMIENIYQGMQGGSAKRVHQQGDFSAHAT